MRKFARGVSFALVVFACRVFAAPVDDATRSGSDRAVDRRQAAKSCDAFLRDAKEALAAHRLPDAERALGQARAEAEKIGPESAEMARTLGGFGALSLVRKQYAEAEAFLLRTFAIQEKILGPDSLSVGGTLDNLAFARMGSKKYADAERTARRALAINRADRAGSPRGIAPRGSHRSGRAR
jgi:tetratricopeptide (TPR) repeat protein